MGTTLVNQLDFLGGPRRVAPSTPLPVLDERERGTTFHEVPVKAILNSPAATGMGFWSLNPCLYRNAEDGPYYDYVLVKGRIDPFRDAPPGPVFRLVDQVKDFRLYAKAPGETWPAWPAADRGPCVRRDRALGEAAAAAAEPYPAD